MKAVVSLLKRHKIIESEVEEELSFHLELLRRKHLQQGMSPAAAETATRKCFGDLKQIKNQCVAISRRRHPLLRALRFFLLLIFLAGILVSLNTAEMNLKHVGDLLIAVSVLANLLLYARALTPARFLSKSDAAPLSILGDASQLSIAHHDEKRRTPFERVISGQ